MPPFSKSSSTWGGIEADTLGGLRPQGNPMVEPLSPEAARTRIIELTDDCYFAPPGSTVADCKAPQRAQVRAAWPTIVLDGTYDDEAELELELLIENSGEHPAKDVRVAIEFGLAYIEVTSEDGSCARGRPWFCSVGDLEVGDKKMLLAKVDLRAGDDPAVIETDRLVVTASSPISELEANYNVGGYDWNVVDCDERYRRMLRRLPTEDFAAKAEQTRKSNLTLPGYPLYVDETANEDAGEQKFFALAREAIDGHGADKYLREEGGKEYQDKLNSIIAMLANGSCEDDPASLLAETEQLRQELQSRKDDVSRMAIQADDLARARDREYRTTMARIQPEAPTSTGLQAKVGQRAAMPMANGILSNLAKQGYAAGAVGEVAGPIGVLLIVKDIVQSLGDGALLIMAYSEMNASLSAIEASAYLEALNDRYAALIEAQDEFRDAIQETYRSECVCKE